MKAYIGMASYKNNNKYENKQTIKIQYFEIF